MRIITEYSSFKLKIKIGRIKCVYSNIAIFSTAAIAGKDNTW